MPLDQAVMDELKSNIAFARTRELSFGLCIGKSPETTVLVCHKTKDADAMGRQAKKDGETSKVASGAMKVEGKILNLSCQGEIPSNIARRTREMLKLAGLKLKVRVLGPDGTAVEEDGDEEDDEAQGGATADPLAEDWRAAKARLSAKVETSRALPDGPGIVDDWQKAVGIADGGDLRGGITALEGLERRITEAEQAATQSDADRQRWEASRPKLEPLVTEVTGFGTAEATKVKAVWDFILGKVNAPVPDYAAAIKAIAMLVKLLQEARAAGPQTRDDEDEGPGARMGKTGKGKATTTPTASVISAPIQPAPTVTAPTGTVTQPQAPTQPVPQVAPVIDLGKPPEKDAPDTEKLAYAEASLKAVDAAILDYMAIIPGSAEVTPATWLSARTKVDAILVPMRGPAGKIDAKKIGDFQKGVDLLSGVIKTKATEKAGWKKTLDLMTLRLVPLERHPEALTTPQIAPKIAALKADLAKAVLKADAQDFKGATSAATPLLARADVIEKLADDMAHYNSVLGQREGVVTAAPLANDATKQVGDLRKAMTKLLTDAKALAVKEKFAEAIIKLDQIPPVHDQYRRTDNLVENYDFYDGKLKTAFEDIDATAANALAPYKKQVDGWKKQYAAAKFAKTKDYAKSARVMSGLCDIVVTFDPATPCWLDREVAANTDYIDALAGFQTQLKTFKDHKGRSGIEEFYQQMERDLAAAQAEAKSGKYSTGTAILQRSEPDWPTYETRADECEAYIVKRDEVAKIIAGLQGKKGAEAGLAQAAALMSSAAQQGVAKSFVSAKASVEEAEVRAGEAKDGADAATELGNLKNNAALGGAAQDIDAAIKVYDDMRGNVAGKDSGGVFGAELAKADLEAKKARDEKAKPAPNFGTAQQGLNAGVAKLEAMLPKIMAQKTYAANLSAAKSLATGLNAKNLDNCIQSQITKINTAITEAETLALPATLDFAGAQAKLVTAREAAAKAGRDGDLWPQMKIDRQTVQTAIDTINSVPTSAAIMGPTLTRLNAFITGIDTKKTAEDFNAASKIAKDGAAEAPKTRADLITANTIIARYKTRYTDRVGAGAGKIPGPTPAAVQSHVTQMNAKHALHQTALAAGNYDAALGLVWEMGWAIDAALVLYGEHATYETARAAAELKVNALRAVRNPHVEEAVKAIEKRYNDAVALSATEKHRPAEAAVTPLPAECDTLIATAGDWKAYDDALVLAQARLDALDTNAQAVAIRPMANALRGKMTGAIATASKGDLKGAKAILDTIPAEADEALRTATATADVVAKAGTVGTTPIDPAVLAEAQTLYDTLAAKPDAPTAKADLDFVRTRLDVAKNDRADPTVARQSLKAAMEALTRAQVTISQTELVKRAIATVKTEVTTLKSHAQSGYIAAETGRMDADIKALEEDIAKNGPDVAGNRVRTLEERCAAAKVLADKHVEYLAMRALPEVEPRLKQLEEHDHRYSVKPQIDALRKRLDEAAAKSVAKDPAGAIKILEAAQGLAQSAWIMAEMRANNPPTPDDVKKIINGPGGDAELDAMLQKLEPDAQRKVLVVAFEARFGCSLESYTGVDASDDPDGARGPTAAGVLDGPNLKKFYDIMIKLPKDHVVNNDSMRKFSNVDDGNQGSLYSDTRKDVVMREGDAVLSGAYGFGRDHEVGGADDNCKPANDKEVTFFSWNTLHEVGHAVDDKLSYMKRNGASDTHGGWVEHVRDTQSIATTIAPHFKYDATYIGQFLAKATPAIPAIPTGETCTPEEWDARRVAFEAWAQTAFTSGNPWASNSTAAKIAIGGVVYHESYDNSWSSYKLAARKQGMTGYQFRAPGEWFAELYAAYHSEKLKPTHPAASWLASL